MVEAGEEGEVEVVITDGYMLDESQRGVHGVVATRGRLSNYGRGSSAEMKSMKIHSYAS